MTVDYRKCSLVLPREEQNARIYPHNRNDEDPNLVRTHQGEQLYLAGLEAREATEN